MSRELIPGWLMGELAEGSLAKDRGYTHETNDKLAGDNASPLFADDVASVGFKCPPQIAEPKIQEGLSCRKAMADQLDQEDKLSFKRR